MKIYKENAEKPLTIGDICAKLSFAACMGFSKMRYAHLFRSESRERIGSYNVRNRRNRRKAVQG